MYLHLIQVNVMARGFTCLVPKVEREIIILICYGTLPNAIIHATLQHSRETIKNI